MASEANHNELDKKLLQDIDTANQSGIPIASGDPILPLLLQYRITQKAHFEKEIAGKEAVWEKINQATIVHNRGRILQFISSSTAVQKWAAAAVVLIALAIGLFYNQIPEEPALLAEAGNAIESITLKDGSEVTLRLHSRLYRVAEKSGKQIYELEGEAFFEVAKNENRTFSVQTAEGTVSVLGTRFNLSTLNNLLKVYLEEGSIKVEGNSTDKSVVLKPGESASVLLGGDPQMQDYDAREVTGWLSQSLIFSNRAVTDIIQELEHHFDLSIEIPSEILQERLTGELSIANLDTMFVDLGLVLGGTFNTINGQVYTFNYNQ